ncbi:MAG TPA: NAD(P)H-hydrate dehydratase [Candidatus Nitrosocosmicus sp.]
MEVSHLLQVNDDYINKILIPRRIQSRKGENGIVLIMGGSRIYHGAPILSSIAALKSGTDLVYTAIPKINISSSRSMSPDLIFLPLPDDKLTMGSARKLFSLLPKKVQSAGIGMGMSITKAESLCFLIRTLLRDKTNLILDASSLIPAILPEIINTKSIVTPHAGEYERLFGEPAGTSRSEQISNVISKSKEYGIVIVLKGFWNIVADGDNVTVIDRTTPAMTIGGTGDILSGLIAGFLTKNNPFESSILGLYFNGLSALHVFDKHGLHILASDLLNELSIVMKPYDKIVN